MRQSQKKASIPTQYLAESGRQRMPLQQQNKLMKELLKLLPIMGLASFMGLFIACSEGDDGADEQVEDPESIEDYPEDPATQGDGDAEGGE